MSVKDFKEEIIKKNLPVIRWDFESDQHETKYKVWVGDEHMKMFVIDHDSIEQKQKLEAFLNKKHKEYKAKNEPKKDAPFYQGMTKEKVRESIILQDFLHDVVTADIYKFGHVVVLVWGADSVDFTIELVRDINDNGRWFAMGENTPYYKELIQLESPTKNIGGKVCELVAEKKELKEKAVFEEHQHQKHLMEQESERKKEESEMKAKAQFKEPQLTAQDLIQAAKDELMRRVKLGKTPAHNVGFVYCIEFMEQTMGKDPYKN